MNTDEIVSAAKYYDNLLDDLNRIQIPKYVRIHHYLGIIIFSVCETQVDSFFILPLISMLFTHHFIVKAEYRSRVIERCMEEEMNMESLTNHDRDIIFHDCENAVSATGFLYTRGVLLVRSLVLIFLIYYATLGFMM